MDCGNHTAWVRQQYVAVWLPVTAATQRAVVLHTADTPEEDVVQWGQETFQYWLKLFASADAFAAGMQLVDAFQLWEVRLVLLKQAAGEDPTIFDTVLLQHPTPDPVWRDIVPSFCHLTQKELGMFQGHAWRYGWKYTTLICDSQKYMQYLMRQFTQVGHQTTLHTDTLDFTQICQTVSICKHAG